MINWTSTKFKTSTLQKDPVKRITKQAIDWEETFTKYIPDKGLYSEYIKNSQNSTQVDKRFEQAHHQTRYMTNKHIKRCLSLLIINKTQI